MTKVQLKAFLFNLISFVILFVGFRYLIARYSNLLGFWIPLTSFVIGTILAPKFQAVKTKDGYKLFMKWMFIKGVREIS